MLRDSTISDRALIGLLLIALGVMFLLDSVEVFGPNTHILGTYWPVLLVAWGLWGLVSSGFQDKIWPMVVLAIGVVLLLNKLDALPWSIWTLWPVILIAIGLALLSRWRIGGPPLTSSLAKGRRTTHIFGGGEERVAQDFEGGQLTVIFGGSKLDLVEATLRGGKAVLDATIVFGGLELRVPRDWLVNVHTAVLFGGVDSKHRQPSSSEATGELNITGTVLFGGIEVKDQ